jgi:hypothetical protein
MAYVKANLNCVSAGSSTNVFTYSSDDAQNVIKASEYFKAYYNNFKVGDLIITVPPAAGCTAMLMIVTAVASTGVTVG